MTHDPALTGKHPTDSPTPQPSTRDVGALRHLASAALALIVVPVGYVCLDYTASRGYIRAVQGLDESAIDAGVAATTLGAMLCFVLAATAGRLSGLGPLVAGMLWGVVPAVWVVLDYPSITRQVFELPDVLYDRLGLGLVGAGFVVFPAVAGLLLGAAVAGSWRTVTSSQA